MSTRPRHTGSGVGGCRGVLAVPAPARGSTVRELVPTTRLAGSSQPAAARLSPATCVAAAQHRRGSAGPLRTGCCSCLAWHGMARHGTAWHGRATLPQGHRGTGWGQGNPGIQAKGPCLQPWSSIPGVGCLLCCWCPQGKGESSSEGWGSPRAAVRGEHPRHGGCPPRLLCWGVDKGTGAGSFPRATPGPALPWALPLGICGSWCQALVHPLPPGGPLPQQL